jgi:hypothetical protein
MDNFLIIFLCWWALNLIVSAVTFGTVGYVIFKLLRGKDKYWYLGALITAIIFLCWDGYISRNIIKRLDISIGNETILKLLNYDVEKIFIVTPSDIAIIFVQMFIGFKIGQIVVNKLNRRS